jgi:phospholipid/cholesterol/gamma-HCH transport system ATP-binding protein
MPDADIAQPVVVEARGVSTRFGRKVVHDGISLDIRRGEIFAIVGGSGSGKSTLMREMVLLLRPSGGSIRVFGSDVAAVDLKQALALRRRIGVLFQNGALFSGQTVLENVAAPLHEHTRLTSRLVKEIAAMKIALAGLEPDAAALYPSQLSGGMRKRAALARALALDPELLFLDEPSSGLDPVSADAFDELILQLKRALGLTIVMVTHDMDSLWRVADRVVLLGQARILGYGTMEELAGSGDPLVRDFFQGPRGRAAQRYQT